MAPSSASAQPGLASFLRAIPSEPEETLIELLISLLRRRQIRSSRPCAIATAYLLRCIVVRAKVDSRKTSASSQLIQRVQETGRRLIEAQPCELVVGNLVRRVLGLIREEQDNELADGDGSSYFPSRAGSEYGSPSPRGTKSTATSQATTPVSSFKMHQAPHPIHKPAATETRRPQLSQTTSMFSLVSHPNMGSVRNSPVSGSPSGFATPSIYQSAANDICQEVVEGIGEIIEELEQSDEQIASYAPDQIHTDEVILTYSASPTVHRFLLKAASKRRFTVIYAESFPNNHQKVHGFVTGKSNSQQRQGYDDFDDLPGRTQSFQKTLTGAGVTVVVIPDSAVFALMSRVNKVILSTHAILSNGALLAPAGTKLVAKSATAHRVPVVVLAATYQLTPTPYPHDPEAYLEYGDPAKVVPYQDRELVDSDQVEIENPLWDFVPPDCVDMYVTNLGGHAPRYLYRVMRDQYRDEDLEF